MISRVSSDIQCCRFVFGRLLGTSPNALAIMSFVCPHTVSDDRLFWSLIGQLFVLAVKLLPNNSSSLICGALGSVRLCGFFIWNLAISRLLSLPHSAPGRVFAFSIDVFYRVRVRLHLGIPMWKVVVYGAGTWRSKLQSCFPSKNLWSDRLFHSFCRCHTTRLCC